jgi:hypothetical protein
VTSQHGEDAVIESLVSKLENCGRVFVEIGIAANENNTNALARAGWTGHVVERHPKRCASYRRHGFPVTVHEMTVTPENLPSLPLEPDVFSLDIDSFDYSVAAALLQKGFRPRIAVLEYNRNFSGIKFMPWGPTDKYVNFGASLDAWRALWEPLGYVFVGTEAQVNCFFVRC